MAVMNATVSSSVVVYIYRFLSCSSFIHSSSSFVLTRVEGCPVEGAAVENRRWRCLLRGRHIMVPVHAREIGVEEGQVRPESSTTLENSSNLLVSHREGLGQGEGFRR